MMLNILWLCFFLWAQHINWLLGAVSWHLSCFCAYIIWRKASLCFLS